MENKNSYLQNKIEKLEHRIKYLEELLERNNISYAKEFTSPFNDYIFIKEEEITPKHAKLFYSMFKGLDYILLRKIIFMMEKHDLRYKFDFICII